MIAFALALVLLSAPAPSVRAVRYPWLALQADVICVGTVESVVSVGDQPRAITLDSGVQATVQPFVAARLRIEEVWKGAPELREAWFVGSRSWVCDSTSAEVGDHLLLLLERWSAARLEQNAWSAELRQILHGQPFHSIEWAGRGELRIRARDGEPGAAEPGVVLGGLSPLEERGAERVWRSLAQMRELTRSILAENALGTVLDPVRGAPALAAILRQELAADGTTRTSVVTAIFERSPFEEAIWSASASGAGEPWRRGFVKDGCAALREFARRGDAREWLEPRGALPARAGARELLVLRDPLWCCTRAEPDAGADDADARLWRELRGRIQESRPAEARDAPGLVLSIGR